MQLARRQPEISELPPLQNQQPSTDQQKIVTGDYVCGPTPAPNLVQIRPRELLGKCVKYNENFIYVAQLQPAQQQHGGLYVLLLFLIYFFGYFYRFLSDQSQNLPLAGNLNPFLQSGQASSPNAPIHWRQILGKVTSKSVVVSCTLRAWPTHC